MCLAECDATWRRTPLSPPCTLSTPEASQSGGGERLRNGNPCENLQRSVLLGLLEQPLRRLNMHVYLLGLGAIGFVTGQDLAAATADFDKVTLADASPRAIERLRDRLG